MAPLSGIRVVEFAGLAPGPFAGLVLADWGADVVRVDRPGLKSSDTLARGKRSIALDLKSSQGIEVARRLVEAADVLIDPFRPGVLERVGVGPEVFLGNGGKNTRLVYARLAGFPSNGPHRDMAGHDINYLALSGVLSMLPGTSSKPAFPLNLLADFGGGGLTCALGILLALLERTRSGLGQVVSTDMVSGTRYLSTYPLAHSLSPNSSFFGSPFPHSPPPDSKEPTRRMTHTLDGGCPFYAVYTCADGRWISIGCLEPQFYAAFLDRFLGVLPGNPPGWRPKLEEQYDKSQWPALSHFLEHGFRLFERDQWARIFDGSDACVVPVLSPSEASVLACATSPMPAPHPLLSRTPANQPASLKTSQEGEESLEPGKHTIEVLREWLGISNAEAVGINAQKSRQNKAKL